MRFVLLIIIIIIFVEMQGDQKHLKLAHLFDKPCFLGLLAVQVR